MTDGKQRSSIDESGNVYRLSKSWRVTLGQIIGDDDCPFMRRWVLIHEGGAAVRIHHFFPDHEDQVPHDHPFSFVTVVLRGGYTDYSYYPKGHVLEGKLKRVDLLRIGSIRRRHAEHAHRTKTGRRGAWTLMINAPKIRSWGFLPRLDGWPTWVPWTSFIDTGMQRAACEPVETKTYNTKETA